MSGPIEAMLATCGNDLKRRRDRALLLFGVVSGGRRRSDIAGGRVEQLQRLGPFQLGRSKTEQEGPSAPRAGGKPLVGRAAAALETQLTACGITDGCALLAAVGHAGGPALSSAAVGAHIQRRAQRAGLTTAIGGHSLRPGFVTEAGARGVPYPRSWR